MLKVYESMGFFLIDPHPLKEYVLYTQFDGSLLNWL